MLGPDDVVVARAEDVVDKSLADVELVDAPAVVVVTALEVLEPVDGGTELVVADGTLVLVEFGSELVVLPPDGGLVPGEPLPPGELPFEPGAVLLPGLVVVGMLLPGLVVLLEPVGEPAGELTPGLPVPVPLGRVVGLVEGVVVGLEVDGEPELAGEPAVGLPD